MINVYTRSNFGFAFHEFWKNHLAAIDNKTTVIILGDARNNYNDAKAWCIRDIQNKAKNGRVVEPREPVGVGVRGFGDGPVHAVLRHRRRVSQSAAALEDSWIRSFSRTGFRSESIRRAVLGLGPDGGRRARTGFGARAQRSAGFSERAFATARGAPHPPRPRTSRQDVSIRGGEGEDVLIRALGAPQSCWELGLGGCLAAAPRRHARAAPIIGRTGHAHRAATLAAKPSPPGLEANLGKTHRASPLLRRSNPIAGCKNENAPSLRTGRFEGERRWTHSMGGERLDISEEMTNPPPLRNPKISFIMAGCGPCQSLSGTHILIFFYPFKNRGFCRLINVESRARSRTHTA